MAGARWWVGVVVRVRMKVEGEGVGVGWWERRSRRVNMVGCDLANSIVVTAAEAELSTASVETVCICVSLLMVELSKTV